MNELLNRLNYDFSNDIVAITGSSGQLGSFYAEAFLEMGAQVIGLDIASSSNQIQHERFTFIEADVTSKKSLLNAVDVSHKKELHPTILINNAGLDSPPSANSNATVRFEEFPKDIWDKVIDVNLTGTFLCCQIFGADMASRGKGVIVNISSIYGMVSPDQSIYDYKRLDGEAFYKPVAYSASKSGILNLTRYLATYWAKNNVRVNTLTLSGVYNNQDREFIDSYTKRIPIGRMAHESEYIGPLMFLCSDHASYMIGSNLIIDGGWTSI
jgi:NAD(P)-dependent dehydrogenase (short-subunit alcohol dehydrogenase family)